MKLLAPIFFSFALCSTLLRLAASQTRPVTVPTPPSPQPPSGPVARARLPEPRLVRRPRRLEAPQDPLASMRTSGPSVRREHGRPESSRRRISRPPSRRGRQHCPTAAGTIGGSNHLKSRAAPQTFVTRRLLPSPQRRCRGCSSTTISLVVLRHFHSPRPYAVKVGYKVAAADKSAAGYEVRAER